MSTLDQMWADYHVDDNDNVFVIDPFTRDITTKHPQKTVLIEGDHNSERFTFELPRYVEGYDIAKCNVVQVCYNNVGTGGAGTITGVYTVTDMTVYNFVADMLTFSWLISANATKHPGKLNFMVRFAVVDDNAEIKYAWSTNIYEGIRVVDSINADVEFEDEYVDVIRQWENEVMGKMYKYVEDTVDRQVDVAQISTNAQNIYDLARDSAVLKARMDTFTSLEEGSTTGDAELHDIRVGVDGIIRKSAGESVREQIDDLASGITTNDMFLDNQIRSYNLNNLGDAHVGYYLSTNDEILTMSDSQAYSDYIAVKEGEKYIARHPWGAQWSVSFYDEYKQLVSQQSYTEDTPIDGVNNNINASYWHCITIPVGIRYIRTNFGTSNPLNSMIVKGSTVSDIPTEYSEYAHDILAKKFLAAIQKHVEKGSGIIKTEDNTVLGYNALPISDGVRNNVAVGAHVLENIKVDTETDDQSGRYNVGVGGKAMQKTTTGNHNTACGFQAMMGNTTGTANTAVGEDALMSNADGDFNVAIGCRALQSATAGEYNVAVGLGAGYWNDEMKPTGSRNTMVGAHSGQANGAGSDNIAIGYFAKATNGLNNTIVIGNSMMATKDGQTVIGSYSTTETIIVDKGIKRKIIFNDDGTCTWESVE